MPTQELIAGSYEPLALQGDQIDSEMKCGPICRDVFTWVILFPLLYLTADSSLSIFNPFNSAMMTTNANLLKVYSGFRPEVVVSFAVFLAFGIFGIQKSSRVALRNKLLSFGPILAALSALWSYTPFITLRTAFEFTLATLFAYYLTEKFPAERFMRILIFTGVVAAFSSILLVLLAPQYGIYHRDGSGAWQGICSHKNFLGLSMAFLLTPIFYVKEKLHLRVLYALLLIFLIVMSQSRGAWLDTLGILLFIPWLAVYRRLNSKDAMLFIAVTFVLVLSMIGAVFAYLDPFIRFVGKDPTLTGRTGIWLAVLQSIAKRPILGYGFGSFWLGLNPESFNIAVSIHWMNIGYAENGFLELWLELGTVGLVICLILFGRALVQGLKLARSKYYTPQAGWFLTLIVLELLTNIDAGVVMTAPSEINWTLTIIACVGLTAESQKIRRAQNKTAESAARKGTVAPLIAALAR
ncbi:MAG TPA: O-antigen ligase [Bryobacteraceae bacterium]|jgi:O-antigen ligase|nr:O-antigen ligase [Bryobacteraceae bacterium]